LWYLREFPSAANTLGITVWHNDAATPMTCSFSIAKASGSTGTCTDSTHTFTVAAGDRLAYSISTASIAAIDFVTTNLVCQ